MRHSRQNQVWDRIKTQCIAELVGQGHPSSPFICNCMGKVLHLHCPPSRTFLGVNVSRTLNTCLLRWGAAGPRGEQLWFQST